MNHMKFFRLFSDMSQDDLSQQTGINQTRISRIERKIVTPNDMEKKLLARALDKDPKAVFPEK